MLQRHRRLRIQTSPWGMVQPMILLSPFCRPIPLPLRLLLLRSAPLTASNLALLTTIRPRTMKRTALGTKRILRTFVLSRRTYWSVTRPNIVVATVSSGLSTCFNCCHGFCSVSTSSCTTFSLFFLSPSPFPSPLGQYLL